jgi:serine/threonine protein kinase/Leucine-rich repeat (LRR) protein
MPAGFYPEEVAHMTLQPKSSERANSVHPAGLETIVRGFEAAWFRREHPDIDAALVPLAGAKRSAALVELVHAELELRLKAGETARVEDYLRRYPELSGQADVVVNLIATEQRQRSRTEPGLALAEYRARFPHLVAELDALFADRTAASTGSGCAALTAGADVAVAPACGNLPEPSQVLAPAESPGELGRLGPYRVLKVLGRGGMGMVFLAEDPHLQRLIALKVMLPALAASGVARERFLREARTAAALKHDHIVTIHQVGEDRGAPYLAMEFLDGQSLDARLEREQKLPVAEVLRIGREIAEGLAAAHQRGRIHRDIKPANIWLEDPTPRQPACGPADHTPTACGCGCRVKLLDFGLARDISEEAHLTQSGALIGTPAYMAPEQARGDEASPRTDLFSLGVTLYRMLTGQLPFRGNNTLAVLDALARHTPPAPHLVNADVPPALSRLVMRLLDKDPSARPASARQVVEELAALERQPTQPRPRKHKRSHRLLWLALGAAATVVLAGIVLFWQTPRGTVRIEINDPGIKVALDKDGLTIPGADRQDVSLTAGEHSLHVKRGDLEFDTDKFVLKKGETVTLQVELLAGKVQVVQDGGKVIGATPPIAAAWFREVADLPAEKQVEAVAAKLKERNPGFDGKVTHEIRGREVTELRFVTDHVTDISPVRALTGLSALGCNGTSVGEGPLAHGVGQLADLSPLKGLPLTWLECNRTRVSDLSPLQGMRLTGLECGDTNVSDLSPLKGMPLTHLEFGVTNVSDLSPLRDIKLKRLGCFQTKVSDLAPLRGMPLEYLRCHTTRVSDLTPLKDAKLMHLDCGENTQVADLSPLKGMPLTYLNCHDTRVSDLAPLKDMKLAFLDCRGTRISDLAPLMGMPLTCLRCGRTRVSDLSPLVGMPLTQLDCAVTAVADLASVRGMPLTTLRSSYTQVADLSPLKGLKLTELTCDHSRVSDLSPLKDLRLTELQCDFKPERDADILRSIKTLEKVNGKPAQEFWKEVDAKPPANKP